jgi:hypothetical protein
MSRTGDRSHEVEHSRITGEAPWWRRIRVASVSATVGAIAVMGSLMLTSNQQSSAATVVSAAAVSVRAGSDNPVPSTADMPADMAGMDMSGSTPTPTASMPAGMAGMDMSGSTPTPTASMPAGMAGMDMSGSSSGAPAHRPLAPVLGTFGGASAAILLAASMMRRKALAADLAKKAARISGRAGK